MLRTYDDVIDAIQARAVQGAVDVALDGSSATGAELDLTPTDLEGEYNALDLWAEWFKFGDLMDGTTRLRV